MTGGAGYVGSVLVAELLGAGHRVRVLDSLAHGNVGALLVPWGGDDFEFVRGDVRDRAHRTNALRGVDAVVHLAAIVGDPACAREPDLARAVNLEATRALAAEAEAGGVERFVFASTCSNYGRMPAGNGLATEDFDLRPVSLYAETKVDAELDLLSARNGLATCCLRFATVYGASPRMRFDLTVNEFAREVALERDLVVFGEQFWRPYVHVHDAARAVRIALEAPVEAVRSQVFNVGSTDENYRKLDIVDLLRQRVPEARVSFVHREEDPRDYRVSFEKVKHQLGFEATRTVADGIDEVMSLVRSGILGDPDAPVFRN